MLTAAGFEKALAYWPMFLQGVVCTVSLSALTVIFGFILALLLAVMRLSNIYPFRSLGLTKDGRLRDGGFLLKLSRFNPLRFLATVYVELFRATPMVVQIFLIFYVVFADIKILPGYKLFGFIRFDRFFPAVVALALNSGAYLSEIIRSGIQSIDGGQTEAARSLGLNQVQSMRFVVLPQAIKNILPAIANEFVTIIKESAICYTIGVQDIMSVVNSVKGATYRMGEALVIATGGYAYNPELAKRFTPEVAGTMGIGHPMSTGDGIIMASNVGACTSHTDSMMCVLKDYEIMTEYTPTSAAANVFGFTSLPNMIMVGAEGKRFYNEDNKGYMSQDLNRPVFDQMHKDELGYVWMVSDQACVDATEGKTHRGEDLTYVAGETVEELAANMGVDAEGLAATIDAYNAAVEAGFDAEFGRVPTTKLEAPFVALAVTPCVIITYGGIARNENGEVIRADGVVIPGLYTAGEASANSAYMGFTISNAFTWGRIAGSGAAAFALAK